jgi:leucyl/phenylalanyl-tRNA--protein transferase
MDNLSPDNLLNAYAQGAFPMGDADGKVRFYFADPRGVIPLDDRFIIRRSLRQTIRRGHFHTRINHSFREVILRCRDSRPEGSWINNHIVSAYCTLHDIGFAHSVETWNNDRLVGGLYGVSMGAAFFGESMFHAETDASKVAMVALVDRLRQRSFELLDAQAVTSHLRTFGCLEVPGRQYLTLLHKALTRECQFD